jgi:hypothetical protein
MKYLLTMSVLWSFIALLETSYTQFHLYETAFLYLFIINLQHIIKIAYMTARSNLLKVALFRGVTAKYNY